MIRTARPGFSSVRAAIAVIAMALIAAAAPVGLKAQTEQTASLDPLNLPEDIVMLGQQDPALRTATAKVNGYVITQTDINQRVALVLDANQGVEISDEELQELRMRVLRNLIDETLQIQEAAAQELEVTADEVRQTYNNVAAQNGFDPEEMAEYLEMIGSSVGSLQRQIQGEMAWQRLVQRMSLFVNVSEEEVQEVLKRLRDSQGTEEYRLAEIYLSATPETQEAVFENGERIVEQLRRGGSFAAYARQFSEASTAAVGGDLGWVRLGVLPSEMATVVQQMQPGQMVGPVQIPGGFTIMLLIDRRQILTADPRDAVLSLKQISIAFPEGMTVPQAEARLAEFTAGIQQMRGCGGADSVAAQIGADVVSNDQISARQLPAQVQEMVLALQVGQSTPPFGSMDEGVRVLMLCGRDDPEVDNAPSSSEIRDQLENERIDKRAQRYLRDLRRDAIIEYN
ncbi:MAG TPA: peptidylprolyl isomerase [Sphingomonadaceae bacterium]|nr:peptidylprolyl isomerase [Sphingomonadaceae bacterium]